MSVRARVVVWNATLAAALLVAGCMTDFDLDRLREAGVDGARDAGSSGRNDVARLDAVDADPSDTGLRCEGGLSSCVGVCVDLRVDTSHCGACGNACAAGRVCIDGTCVLRCAEGEAECDDTCRSLRTDVSNCGACGRVCAAGPNARATCNDGLCGLACDAGYADCDGDPATGCEIDTRVAAAHCGGCGLACPAPAHAMATCEEGRCGIRCEAGWADCDGMAANGCEVQLGTDPRNCGACGTVCPQADNTVAICRAGVCGRECAAGWADCDGLSSNGCEASLAGTLNCGRCGMRCEGSTPYCTASGSTYDCVSGCSASTVLCSGTCVDTRSDPNHCGGCGVVCPAAPHSARVCTAGRCGTVCDAGFADCDGESSNGCEVNLQLSPRHCGACGTACPSGPNATAICTSGRCSISCSPGFADCDGNPTNGCETNLTLDAANCGTCGTVCPRAANASGVCSMGRCGLACDAGFADCNGMSADGCEVNTLRDASHCGGCGGVCPTPPHATATCSAGRCASVCVGNWADCNGMNTDGCEVDLASSVANCGACGNACPSAPNASATCSMARCGLLCTPGFADCDRVTATGCETNLATDVSNCGSCGNACTVPANATAICSASGCGFACLAGFGNCDGRTENGCEVSTASDPAHCGSCGNACPSAPNASAACSMGRCGLLCAPGYADCDRVSATGCEANLATDLSNCGSCGNVCTAPANATAICNASGCGFSCLAGFGNCDGMAANGCESMLATDVMNCGGCGRACATRSHASANCAAGACVYTCSEGWGDCNGSGSDGCEVDLKSDPVHCGMCGHACGLLERCVLGVCTASGG